MIHRATIRTLLAASVLGGLAACGARSGTDTPTVSPTQLEFSRREIPAPGLCRIGETGASQRTCDGIEFAAPPGSSVLYRPDDGSRRVVVCYLDVSDPGVIVGVDVFDIDTRRHIEVILSRKGPPWTGTCRAALISRL
jgi:hypothetical protein